MWHPWLSLCSDTLVMSIFFVNFYMTIGHLTWGFKVKIFGLLGYPYLLRIKYANKMFCSFFWWAFIIASCFSYVVSDLYLQHISLTCGYANLFDAYLHHDYRCWLYGSLLFEYRILNKNVTVWDNVLRRWHIIRYTFSLVKHINYKK